jgi:DNA repair protein RecO (recombination protein O)
MRPQRTEAIILQTFPARERDKLVVFLTPDHGKRKGWAYGARSLKSRFGAALEPLAKVKIGFVERESEEVVRIESVDLIRSLFPAQQNLVSSIAASYIAETVDTFAQSEDPAELIYRLLDRTTEALLAGADPVAVVAYAEVWILKLAGIVPAVPKSIDELMRLPVADFVARKPSSAVLSKMRALATGVRRDFLGHELKSFAILAGVIDS